MNGASLCNSLLLHSRFSSPCSIPSSVYLSPPCFTTSAYISFPRAGVTKRSDGFRSFAVSKRRSSIQDDVEEEEEDDDDEDWDEFEVEAEAEGDEDEGEFLPMEKMKRWLEKKPRGFGVGKKYETLIEDKLLEEIEQSWKAQAANLNKLKNNDPLKPQHNLIKGETQSGFRVRVTNLPKKKNVHRDLKAAFKEVSGVLNIEPAVSGNKKTKDPVCKGFALVDFRSEVDANRFVEQFNGERLSFGKVVKQIKCQVVEVASNQSVSEELRSDTVFEELPFHGLEAVSSVGVVEEDTFVDSWEEESSDDSDKEGDETEVEEEENLISSSIEPPKERESKTNVKSQKQVMKRETREHEVLETPLVSFQAVSKPKEARVDNDDEHGRSDEEEVAEENLEPLKSSVSSSDEERIDRIRRLELKLLGREKLLGGGAGSDKPEAKAGGRVEGETKKKKKKKKVLVKGKKSSTIEIPGSSKRLKMKEKALLTGVLVKYAAKVASTSNDE
ncbi:hypothetical protein HID58_027107 [Brassica napus]|uniref:RRM domain-containing protein n=1 Tax=Brassica napus TaxID=3708 RepID=A0ABQ8CRI3_BRANA|nr:protein DEK [Brassica napus]XP_048591829.1 protein DEK [Brassica napus]KAH0919447.1 hypothetical protein HID58_027107 [Brassica napus]